MSMTGRNILLSLLLSMILTFIVSVVYILYPLIDAMIINRESAGIGSVSGGSLSILLFIIQPISFLVIFTILQWRSKKS